MRPILLLLLVVMIASAIWLSFGRVQARSEFVEGASPPAAPGAVGRVADESALVRAEAALDARIAVRIAVHEGGGRLRISNEEARAHMDEARVPATLHALHDRFLEAYIVLLASGMTREAALAELAELERDAIEHVSDAGR